MPKEVLTAFSCQHAQQRGKDMGVAPDAGAGCSLYEPGRRKAIDPELARRVEEKVTACEMCGGRGTLTHRLFHDSVPETEPCPKCRPNG